METKAMESFLKDGADEIGKNSLSNSTTCEFITGVMPLV
jgi:hypothetical protein